MFFDEVRVPAANLLGEAGQGFKYLVHNLAEERMTIALGATAQAAAAVRHTVAYVKERKAFGRAVSTFQNTKFVLADCTARVRAMQAMTDKALDLFDAGELTAVDAAACKLFASETMRPSDRPMPAVARRLRVRHRIPDRPPLHRHPGDPALRRHVRDYARHHCRRSAAPS